MTNRNQTHPTSDREALSALFDGELVGDVARFALKRLDHDQDWRETCERWQRVGDALRGQGALLPAAFPSRVRAAVRADAMRHDMHGVAIPAVANARSGFRWGSVGLAASAAVVAFVLARMPMSDTGTAEPMVAGIRALKKRLTSSSHLGHRNAGSTPLRQASPPTSSASRMPAMKTPQAAAWPGVGKNTATASVAIIDRLSRMGAAAAAAKRASALRMPL